VNQFQLWTIADTHKMLTLDKPKLASWNANSDPEQIALKRYLDDIEQKLHPLPQVPGLFLHMVIDVKNPAHLLHHHDLDNYLYPVVYRLGASRFSMVSASKRIGGGSYLQIGQTQPENVSFLENDGWQSFQHNTGRVSTAKSEWKAGIRDKLKTQQIHQLQSGAVDIQLIWKCSSRRNWINLWKPTIDAMGPVLGEPDTHRPFHPNDDRIVSLKLHLNPNDSSGWSVDIGMMWRPSSNNSH
jgi:hypothetical protein